MGRKDEYDDFARDMGGVLSVRTPEGEVLHLNGDWTAMRWRVIEHARQNDDAFTPYALWKCRNAIVEPARRGESAEYTLFSMGLQGYRWSFVLN